MDDRLKTDTKKIVEIVFEDLPVSFASALTRKSVLYPIACTVSGNKFNPLLVSARTVLAWWRNKISRIIEVSPGAFGNFNHVNLCRNCYPNMVRSNARSLMCFNRFCPWCFSRRVQKMVSTIVDMPVDQFSRLSEKYQFSLIGCRAIIARESPEQLVEKMKEFAGLWRTVDRKNSWSSLGSFFHITTDTRGGNLLPTFKDVKRGADSSIGVASTVIETPFEPASWTVTVRALIVMKKFVAVKAIPEGWFHRSEEASIENFSKSLEKLCLYPTGFVLGDTEMCASLVVNQPPKKFRLSESTGLFRKKLEKPTNGAQKQVQSEIIASCS